MRSSRSASLCADAREICLLEPARVLRSLLVRRLASLLDLVTDDLHLLVQEQLALCVLDALLDLVHDVLLHAQNGRLFEQRLEEGDEALLCRHHLQERLLLLAGDLQMRGHEIGHGLRVLSLADDVLHLVGHLWIELHIGRELVRHPTRQRPAAGQLPVPRLQRRVVHDEVG